MLRPVVASLAVTELRLHLRHGLVAATAAMTGVWVAALLVLPAPWRATAAGWVLFVELAVLGFFFVPALAVAERGNGVTAALRLTRLAPVAALLVRIGALAGTAVLVAIVVLVTAGVGPRLGILTGVALTSVLTSLVATVMVGRSTTLTAFVARTPAVSVPLMLPALLHGTGLTDAGWTALSPMTGALELLMGRWSWPAAAWMLAWIVALSIAATRIGFDVSPPAATAPPERRATRWPEAPAGYNRWSAVRSLARADRRTIATDGLLVLLVVGVPVLAVALRWLGTAGLTWARDTHGVEFSEHLPLAWAFVLVVHVPVILGTLTGLLFLEDRDGGLYPALATTRASLSTLLAYRLATTTLATAVMVTVAVPLAGARHLAGPVALVLAALGAGVLASLVAVALAALARDRIQGMALVKAAGLPLYLPLGWWFVEAPAGWAFAVVPTAWPARAFWAETVAAAAAFTVGGVTFCLLLGVVLTRRLRRRLAH